MKIWLRLVVGVAALAAMPKGSFAADAAHPTVALSEQFFGPSLAVVASGHE